MVRKEVWNKFIVILNIFAAYFLFKIIIIDENEKKNYSGNHFLGVKKGKMNCTQTSICISSYESIDFKMLCFEVMLVL